MESLMDQLLKDNQREEKKRTGKELNIECCVWGHRMSQLDWDANCKRVKNYPWNTRLCNVSFEQCFGVLQVNLF